MWLELEIKIEIFRMSSSDEFDRIISDSVKKKRRQKKLGIPKPIPINFDSPNTPKANPNPGSKPNRPGDSDSEMDELENFFEKMKTPSRSVPRAPVTPMKDFIVPDGVESEDEFEKTSIITNETVCNRYFHSL